jgi:Ni/Fe-hydrogenase subunit HybB-like protein
MNTAIRQSFWRIIFWLVMAVGIVASFQRFYYGLGASTNLSDRFPWGIWIGFDLLCGVGLAAGGFTLAATVHLFNIKAYEPIVRPAILTAFLGYMLVVLALMFDLGRPYRIWHPLIMWNPRSVMFEVGWCVMLYSTVLFLEFLPVVLERFKLHTATKLLHRVMLPIVIAGVILSTLHQSSLGSVYLIVPNRMHALWYSPWLPLQFYLSAIGVGMAMTIFESWHSARAFGRHLEIKLVRGMTRVLTVVIAVYFAVRGLDMLQRKAFRALFEPGYERWLFLLEVVLMAGPMILFWFEGSRRSPRTMYIGSVTFILGFVTNRLNVGLTGFERVTGVKYFPSWQEIAITLMIIAIGFAIFRFAARQLPIFEPEGEERERGTPEGHQVPVLASSSGD